MVNPKKYKEEGWKCGKCGFKYKENKKCAKNCCIRNKPKPYEVCPECKKKGLHLLAVNDHNTIMRTGIDYECRYCGYTESILTNKRRCEKNNKTTK